MSDSSEVSQYLVKDSDGEYICISADSWNCGGNGLVFLKEGDKVAWFVSWQHFRKVEGSRK